ncbi:MAG TPA: leucine--tRNA ligase, partial [Usitatibacter sp.]
ATEAAMGNAKLAAFIEECKRGGVQEAEFATMEKKGMPTGLFVLHPITGDKVEVWVGNYVLMGYGEGAVMAVPGHDERDFAFALKYGLPIRQVIDVEGREYSTDAWQPWYADYGRNINSGSRFAELDGKDYAAAIDTVVKKLAALGVPAARKVTYRLRDWGISRQRYWGTPIPIIQCAKCGDVGVPDEQLPVVLPENLVPDGTGNPLAKTPSFFETKCPKCGGAARRETDTMDVFIDSSWYFMRYACPDATAMVDERAQYWMPLDMYIGGIEHAILHLLYARFWTKAMRDLGLVKIDEPFANLLTQGMVLNHIFSRRTATGSVEYFAPDEVETTVDAEGRVAGAKLRSDGSAIEYEGLGTMSKSKRNGVDPQDMIEEYGADTSRFYVMQANPPTDTMIWSDQSVAGSFKFLRGLWTLVHEQVTPGIVTRYHEGELTSELAALRLKLHKTIEKVGDDYGRRLQFNTAIAAVREMLNLYETVKDRSPVARAVAQEVLEDAVLLLSPIVPHIATALWRELRPGTELIDQPWPSVDAAALVQDSIELVVQVNGKLRGHMHVSTTASREQIAAAAMLHEAVVKFAAGQTPKKVVVVPGRLVNVVV